MSVKRTPLGAKEKGEFNGAPGSGMQLQLERHQRAAATRSRSKQSELHEVLTCQNPIGLHLNIERVLFATWTLKARG